MIRFNQPRYIIPLIILPFIYVFYFLLEYTHGEEKQWDTPTETAEINPVLPDPFLDEDDLKGKFDAFREAHKHKRNATAIQKIKQEDPLKKQLKMREETQEKRASLQSTYTAPVQFKPSPRKKAMDSYEEQMKLFKTQMIYMDSLLGLIASAVSASTAGWEDYYQENVIGKISQIKKILTNLF